MASRQKHQDDFKGGAQANSPVSALTSTNPQNCDGVENTRHMLIGVCPALASVEPDLIRAILMEFQCYTQHAAHSKATETLRNIILAVQDGKQLHDELVSHHAAGIRAARFARTSDTLNKPQVKCPVVPAAPGEGEFSRAQSTARREGMWCRMCGGACDLEACGMEQP